MRRFIIAVLLATAPAAAPAAAQDLICCNLLVHVNGNWIGASTPPGGCQQYFDKADPPTFAAFCAQRADLVCMNTSRCDELLPAGIPTPDPPPSRGAVLPPHDPASAGGLDDGFGSPTPSPGSPSRPLGPPGLVYQVMLPDQPGVTVTKFTAWLDAAACPIPLAAFISGESMDSAVRQTVFGRAFRGAGRVRIEAWAREHTTGGSVGPIETEAAGIDADAVAQATRAALERLKLVCRR